MDSSTTNPDGQDSSSSSFGEKGSAEDTHSTYFQQDVYVKLYNQAMNNKLKNEVEITRRENGTL